MASFILPVHKASTYKIATKDLTIDVLTKYPLTFLTYDTHYNDTHYDDTHFHT